jgi:hypothetical protein
VIRRNQSGVLAKRSAEDDYDLWAPRGRVVDVMDADDPDLDEVEVDAPPSRAFTRLWLALAALSATPVLFIGGLGGWPWDNEPAAVNNTNTVVAGHEHYPASVKLARLGIDTELDALNFDSITNTLQVPALGRAGWIESGAEPGELGRAVILGRRSQDGDDVFAKLTKARAGDTIVVTTVEGKTLTFVVQSVEQFKAGAVPESRVYGGGKKQAQLRLITSTGTYDQAKGGFPRNVVVFADLQK